MSRHDDDGPPGGTSDQQAPDQPEPTTPSEPRPLQGSHWHLPPGVTGPDHDDGALGHVPPDVPMPGPAIGDRPLPDLSSPPPRGQAGHRPDLVTPGAEPAGDTGTAGDPGTPGNPGTPAAAAGDPGAEANPARLRGFRRRQLPPPEPHRQVPALPAAGGAADDPSETRTIVPGRTAAPGQLGRGIRGQLGPGPISHGERVPSPQRSAPIPRAESGSDPGHPGLGSAGPPGEPGGGPSGSFPVPPELPTPPVRRSVPGEAGSGGTAAGTGPGTGPPAATAAPEPTNPSSPGGPGTRTASGAPRPGQLAAQPRRLTPEQIRTTSFARSALGRRGYNEDEVNQFTNRLAEELAARDAEIVRLIDENHRLKQAMRDWQSERIDQPEVDVADRVNAETAAMVAKAQQHIDAQLAQTELYCRQREQEAVRRYDEIVRHARLQVKKEAEQVAQRYRATSGAGYNADQETLQRQQVYIGALLQALDALGAHVQATRQAFATEIGKLALPAADTPSDVADQPPQRVD